MTTSLSQLLLNLFFPVQCAGCGNSGIALCRQCIQNIPLAPEIDHEYMFAAFDYGSPLVERIIKSCKYYRKSEALKVLTIAAAPSITEFIAEHLQSEAREIFVLVPIPQHRIKTYTRGFNQSQVIAKTLAGVIDSSRVQSILVKKHDTLPQVRMKSKTARCENLKGSMQAVTSLNSHTLYIVVDDVITTGATLTEAMRALKESGAKKILAVALAHGYPKKTQAFY